MSLILILIMSPVMGFICIGYYLLGEKNILFLQQRIGKSNQEFTIYKFRTLTQSGDSFRYGTFLRQTSLDELPQLFNVLKRDVNFIGPRPLLVEYLNKYTTDELKRHLVLPGITGLAQVNGRQNLCWNSRFRYDRFYVVHGNLWLDLSIIFKTLTNIFVKDNKLETNNHSKYLGYNKY